MFHGGAPPGDIRTASAFGRASPASPPHNKAATRDAAALLRQSGDSKTSVSPRPTGDIGEAAAPLVPDL
jgi:hypothetical protein